MRNRKAFLAGLSLVGVTALLLAGGLMASNMGFKLNFPLVGSNDSASISGTNYMGMPYNQQVGINNARDLFLDIGGVQSISQHRKFDDLFEFYTASNTSIPPNGFAINAAEGYIVKLPDNTPYVVVGSHDPGLTVALVGAADPGSISGTNYYTHPYHGVAANAKDLFLEMGAGIQSLSQHRKFDDLFEFYTASNSSIPPNGFLLSPGEAYIVKASSNVPFTPNHY